MLVFAVVGVILIAKLPQTDPTPYVQQALEAYEGGDFERATRAYGQAWNVSQDPKWLVETGHAGRAKGDARIALGSWRRALMIDTNLGQARRAIVELSTELAKLGPTPTACVSLFRESRTLLELEAYREDPLGHYACGWALSHLRDTSLTDLEPDADKIAEAENQAFESGGLLTPAWVLAEAYLARAGELAPDDPQIHASLAEFYERQGRFATIQGGDPKQTEQLYAKAEQLHKDFLKRQPEMVEAIVSYTLYLARRDRPEEALEQARHAETIAPNDSDVQLALAHVYATQSKFEEAEKAFNNAKQLAPERLDTYRQLGLYYQVFRYDLDKSLAVYREALARPIDRDSYRAWADRQIRFHILIRAAEALLGQTEERPADRDSLVSAAQGYHDEAVAELQENAMTYRLQGMIFRVRNHLNEAIRHLENADRAGGGADLKTKLLLANLYVKTAKPGLAERVLEEAQRISPGHLGSMLLLAVVENRLNKPERALLLADAVLQADPENRQALLSKIEAYRLLDKLDRIEPLRKKLATKTPLDQTRVAQVLILENRQDEAEKLLLEILKDNPGTVSALSVLLPMYVSQDRTDEARKVYEAARAAKPDDTQVAALELVLSATADKAARLAQTEQFLNQLEDPLQRALAKANLYMSQEKFEQAADSYREAASLSPDNPVVIEGQFRLALRTNDWQAAERSVGRARELNLDGAEGGFHQGRLLLTKASFAEEAGKPEEAESHLSKAIEALETALRKFPSGAAGHLYLGAAYGQLGRLSESVSAFERVLELNPNSGPAHRGLARILLSMGKAEEASEHVQEAIRLMPNDPWSQEQKQNILEEEQPEEGIVTREKRREADPTDLNNLVRLAGLYAKVGQTNKAEERYLQALEHAPINTNVASRVATFYRDTGRNSEAEKVLKELVRNLDTEQKGAAEVLLARHYITTNQPDKAERAYNLAATLNPIPAVLEEMARFQIGMKREAEALEWYQRALEGARQGKSLSQQRIIHQRYIDLLLRMYERDKAEAELQKYLEEHPPDAWGFVFQGRLRALQNRVEESLDAYTRAVELAPDSAAAHYQVGRLHKMLGNMSLAIDSLRTAAQIAPKGFEYRHRILLAQAYRAAGRADLGISELRQVLADDPEALKVGMALAEILQQEKRYVELESFLRESMGRQPDNANWPMLLGKLAEEQQDARKATAAYLKACKLTGFAPGPVDAMLNVLENAKQYDKMLEVTKVVIPMVRQTGLTDMRVASALHHLGRKDEARQQYDAALAKAANDLSTLGRIVTSMCKALGPEAAATMVEEKLRADPDNNDLLFVLASCLDQAGREKETIELLQPLADRTPESIKKVHYLALIAAALDESGQPEKAAKVYKQALQITPDFGFALNNLAYILAEKLGQPEEALPYARRAFQIARENASVIDTLGWVECLAEKYDSAIGTLRTAVAAAPDMTLIVYHLGEALRRKGDYAAAKHELEKALRLSEASDDQTYLAQIREALGKLE